MRGRALPLAASTLLGCLALGATCERFEGDATQIEIELATNFDPRELQGIAVAVGRGTGEPVTERRFQPDELRPAGSALGGLWLLSFDVVPAGTRGGDWRVEAALEAADRTLLRSTRRGSFREGSKVTVRLFLDRRCVDGATLQQRSCPAGQTCGAGGLCESELSDAAEPALACARVGERVPCISTCGTPGEARCLPLDDGRLALGDCRPFRELAGTSQDEDCRRETPDDGSCAATARAARPGMHDEEACVPGGAFWLGDLDGLSPYADVSDRGITYLSDRPSGVSLRERPARRVTVSALWVDLFEVSVARFREFHDETGIYPEASGTDRGGCTFDPDTAADDAMPMNCVSWTTAGAFCAWDGERDGRLGRLPTEAEWEWVAAGDSERTFPWGEDPPSCERAYATLRWLDELDEPCDPARVEDVALSCEFVGCEAFANVAPRSLDEIAMLPALPGTSVGLYGLVGNVAEWMLDAWDPDAYSRRCTERACDDATVADQNPVVEDAQATSHAVRGGSFASPPGQLRANARASADQPATTLGFRCVRED